MHLQSPLFKKILCILAISLSPLTSKATEGFSVEGTPVPELLKSAWNATVSIDHIFSKQMNVGKEKYSQKGSGFIADYNEKNHTALVVTNAHVVGCPDFFICNNTVTIDNVTIPMHKVKLLKEIRNLDLAFLEIKLKKDFAPTVITFNPNPSQLHEQTPVATVGYPDLKLRKEKTWLSQRPADWSQRLKRFSQGLINGIMTPFYNIKYPYILDKTSVFIADYVLTHNADILKGSSGGPLVEMQSGTVIGINSAIAGENSDYSYCEQTPTEQPLRCSYIAVPSDVILDEISKL